jgi:hypothetical protein
MNEEPYAFGRPDDGVGVRTTTPVATSSRAVVVCRWAAATRGVHPLMSCSVRMAQTTTNSNADMWSGRSIT